MSSSAQQPVEDPAAAAGAAAAAIVPGANTAGIVPTLQNIVATVNLECKLDLKTIALHARNAEYNPKRFAAGIYPPAPDGVCNNVCVCAYI